MSGFYGQKLKLQQPLQLSKLAQFFGTQLTAPRWGACCSYKAFIKTEAANTGWSYLIRGRDFQRFGW
jgi:hypothetical protein